MLWSTLPAVHLIFWAVYLWKLSKRWTGPNTTILQQSVHLPSNSAHFSVCVFIIWSQLSQNSLWQLLLPSYTILYIGFFCYFSGYSLFLLWTIHLTIQVTFAAGHKHYIYYSEKLKTVKCSYFYGDSLVRLQFWKLKSEKQVVLGTTWTIAPNYCHFSLDSHQELYHHL